MNDYARLRGWLDQAIQVTETAYYIAQDDEDSADIDRALDLLRSVRDRSAEKDDES